MAYISEQILGQLGGMNITDLREQLNEFEGQVGAPVRIMQPGEGRTVDHYTRAWTGASSDLTHYPGFTEEDRDNNGVTILTSSWFSHIYENVGNSYITYYFGPDYYTNMERSWATPEVYSPQPNEDSIKDAGGVPFIVTSEEMGSQIYAEMYEGRVLFSRVTPRNLSDYARVNYAKVWFDLFFENASEEAREAARIRREEIQREVFTRMMEDQGNTAIIELRQRGSDLATAIAEAQEKLVNDQATQQQIGRQLSYLIQEEGELTREEVQAEWDSLVRHAKVKEFSLGKSGGEELNERQRRRRRERGEDVDEGTHAWMKIKTEPLWITNPDTGREIPLGEFELTLNFGANTLVINNLTGKKEDRWDHPHVKNGKLCAADYATTITTLLRQRKLAGMTNMVFNILKTVTLADEWGGANILLWEEEDNRLRREKGWPEWSEEENVHPMLAEEEDNEGTDAAGEGDEGDDTDADGDDEPDGATPEQDDTATDTGTETDDEGGDTDAD